MRFLFRDTDAGAPVLNGQSGALVNLLDKVLVDGYGQVNIASMVRVGSIVTVTTSTAHGLQDYATAQVSGAVETAYNGKWRVATVPTSTTFTFDIGVATPTTPATGTMNVKRASVGWTKPFAATNKGAYRMPVGSNQHYLDVDDAAIDTQRSAAVRGYRTMSALATGTEPFPTVAQASIWYIRKSATTDAVARSWCVIADEHCVWLLVAYTGSAYEVTAFGEAARLNALDAHQTFSVGSAVNAASSVTTAIPTRYGTTSATAYMAGDVTGSPGAIEVVHDGLFSSVFAQLGRSNLAVPGSITGDQIITPTWFSDLLSSGSRQIRARNPGIFHGLYHQPTWVDGTIKSDFAEYPGRRFIGFNCYALSTSTNSRTICYWDLDGAWR